MTELERAIMKCRDERVTIDLHTETVIMEDIAAGRTMPSKWRGSYFNPASNLQDAVDFFRFVYPDMNFRLAYSNSRRKFRAEVYVGDSDTISCVCDSPARALFLLAGELHLYCLSEEGGVLNG